jgi:hypothetical protein
MKPSKLFITAFTFLAILAIMGTSALADVSEGHKIRKVKEAGQLIILQDGSEWRVQNPADWDIAYNWLPFQDISILNGNEFRNDHNGERIDVKRLKEASLPKSSLTAPSSTPVYSEKVAGKPYMVKPSPQEAENKKLLNKILERLDTLDAKMQVMDWRLRKIEKESLGKP